MSSMRRWKTLPSRTRIVAVAVAALVAVVGVVMVLSALQLRASTRPVTDGVRVDGVVLRVSRHYKRTTTYQALIAFPTRTGRVIFTGPTVNVRPRIGARVPISYDPANPANAHELLFSSRYVPEFIIGIALMLFVLMAATTGLWRLIVQRVSSRTD